MNFWALLQEDISFCLIISRSKFTNFQLANGCVPSIQVRLATLSVTMLVINYPELHYLAMSHFACEELNQTEVMRLFKSISLKGTMQYNEALQES